MATELKQWADSMQPVGKGNRNTTAAISQAGARSVVSENAARLDARSLEDVLAALRASQRALAASMPAL